MGNKYSYKIKFFSIYSLISLISIFAVYKSFSYIDNSDIINISKKNINSFSKEKSISFNNKLKRLSIVLNHIAKDVKNYTKDDIEKYLLFEAKKNEYFQNLKFNTLIENAYDQIQIKNSKLYIHEKVYDVNRNQIGFLTATIDYLELLKKVFYSELYDVSIFDNSGEFLFTSLKYKNIKELFPNSWAEILSKDKYEANDFYTYKIFEYSKDKSLNILLQYKYSEISKHVDDYEDSFIVILVFLTLLFLPLIFYFAYLPDRLSKKFIEKFSTDELTSLPNKLVLMKDLDTKKFDNSLIIIINIDNLFKIQNTYGYDISNKLLISFIEFFSTYKGMKDFYSISYNTYACIYKYKDTDNLNEYLNLFLKEIENKQFLLEDENIEFLLQITLGVSNPKNIDKNIKKLQEAENALEVAQEQHKKYDIYGVLHENNINYKKENINLAYNIKRYIDHDNVLVYYQPIYNNMTEKIEKYECLIRLKGDDGILYPDTFLPIAKEINQYYRLSYIMIEKAFGFFKDKKYEFSINLSVIDLYDLKFQEFLFDQIKKYNVQDKLVVEIVESESITNYQIFFDFAKKLKKVGAKLAIDDFGSGYSNFNYIIELSDYLDYLKIDGSIVKDIVDSHKIQILIGSLKFYADNLGIQTIAEYVENEEVLRYLTSIGVDYSQGYFIGKPSDELVCQDYCNI